MRKSLVVIVLFAIFGASLESCVTTQKTAYFFDAQDTTLLSMVPPPDHQIQKNDILSISITSLNAEASAVFNSPNTYSAVTATSTGSTTTSGGGYLVNSEGNIQLPILGNIHAAGLTKKELKAEITNQILTKKLLIDPIVTIRHMNYDVTVIGEVGKPTVITVPNEKISLLKALGLAGDITVYGKKENVLLVREVDGKRMVKRIDLNSKDFLTSPYYYLQPNDVVYVEANKEKLINANKSQQMILPSILSALSIIAIVVTQLAVNN